MGCAASKQPVSPRGEVSGDAQKQSKQADYDNNAHADPPAHTPIKSTRDHSDQDDTAMRQHSVLNTPEPSQEIRKERENGAAATDGSSRNLPAVNEENTVDKEENTVDKEETARAATKIQAAARGRADRKRVQEIRSNHGASGNDEHETTDVSSNAQSKTAEVSAQKQAETGQEESHHSTEHDSDKVNDGENTESKDEEAEAKEEEAEAETEKEAEAKDDEAEAKDDEASNHDEHESRNEDNQSEGDKESHDHSSDDESTRSEKSHDRPDSAQKSGDEAENENSSKDQH